MTHRAAPQREEHLLLAAPGRDATVTAVVVLLTGAAFAAVGDHGMLASIQRQDDAWLRLMISIREPPLTVVARGFSILGLVYVTLPVRIAIAGFLALRRRWWHLAAFAAAVVLSEALIGVLKGIYDRPRPPGSLVATTAASFPSGHAIAASATTVAAVIALVPPGRRRPWWGVAAVTFSLLMALSRTYLAAHWLSDALAGVLLGTSCALTTAMVAGLIQRRWPGPRYQPTGPQEGPLHLPTGLQEGPQHQPTGPQQQPADRPRPAETSHPDRVAGKRRPA